MMVNQRPTVSVVMPAFNAAASVRTAVQSVLAQTFKDFELLVINDCSTDETLAILESMTCAHPCMKLLSLPSNGGAAEARNVAMLAARGEFIAFLDADDVWLPQKLELQLPLFDDPEILIVGSWYESVSSAGVVSREVRFPTLLDVNDVLNGTVIGCLTAVFRARGLHGKIVFRPRVERANGALGRRLRWRPIQEDFLFWVELMRSNAGCRMRNVQCSTARYTLSGDSASSNKVKAAYFHWLILRKDLGLPLVPSVLYFVTYAFRAVAKHIQYRRGATGAKPA